MSPWAVDAMSLRIVKAMTNDVLDARTDGSTALLVQEIGTLDRDDLLQLVQSVALLAAQLGVALDDDERRRLLTYRPRSV
ncbi:hypothetical protein GCM10027053_46460 [Intrasporangium mesophilum]